jgi:predicted GH43/DUF377 family glycosyl hydrolase
LGWDPSLSRARRPGLTTSATFICSTTATPRLEVTEPFERDGQVGNVIFLEGLAKKDGQAFFYYGAADDQIAVAVADLKKTPQPPER